VCVYIQLKVKKLNLVKKIIDIGWVLKEVINNVVFRSKYCSVLIGLVR